jgi:hypothetical protein
MDPIVLVAIIVGGVLLLGGTILVLVLSAIASSRATLLAELQAEGIVRDSGPIHVKVTFSSFRGPRVYEGAGVRSGPGRLVLTQRNLRIPSLPQVKYGVGTIARESLGMLQVGVDGGTLHLRGDNLPGTSGTVEFFLGVADAPDWMAALVQAGARPRGG